MRKARIRKLQTKLENIMKAHPHANRENVWHTMLLLEEKPIERLERGLTRAQKAADRDKDKLIIPVLEDALLAIRKSKKKSKA